MPYFDENKKIRVQDNERGLEPSAELPFADAFH